MTKAPKMTFEKLEQNVVDTVLADLENGELSVWKKRMAFRRIAKKLL